MEWHVDSVCHALTNSIIAVILFVFIVCCVRQYYVSVYIGGQGVSCTARSMLDYRVRLPC